MKKIILLLLLFSASLMAFSQQKINKYYVNTYFFHMPPHNTFTKKDTFPDGKFIIYSIENYNKKYTIKWFEGEKKNNQRQGKWIAYYINGSKYMEANYLDNKKNGKEITYDITGKIIQEKKWSNDKVVGQSFSQNVFKYVTIPVDSISNYTITIDQYGDTIGKVLARNNISLSGYYINDQDRIISEFKNGNWTKRKLPVNMIKHLLLNNKTGRKGKEQEDMDRFWQRIKNTFILLPEEFLTFSYLKDRIRL